MKLLRQFWTLLRRRNLERNFDEEVRQHLELKVAENMARGMPAEEALRSAYLEFGNPALAKEHSRQSWGFPRLESVWQDVRFAFRQLRKSPGFTLVAVITLALGIGANSVIFSFVNAFLLSSLPVKNPQEIVHLGDQPQGGFEQKPFEYLRDHNHTLAGLIAWDDGNIALTVDGETTIVRIDFITANSYSLLGVPAYRGRMFTPEDDLPGSPAVAVVSYAYWQQRFALDPSVIGKTVQFKDVSCTIVGIAPPWFHGLRIGGAAVPVTLPAQWHQHLALKDNTTFELFGRLGKGVDMKQAQADLDLVYHQELQAEAGKLDDPAERKKLLERHIVVGSARESAEAFDRQFALQLRLLEAVVGLVLLIACANLANLVLARGNARRREISTRLALGARRSRIVRQLLTEHLLLALCGGGVGLLLAVQLTHVVLFVLQGRSDAAALGVRLDGTVLGFTAVLSLVTGFVFGVIPAVRASQFALTASATGDALSAPGKPRRAGRLLVAPQIAISLAVLILSGLLLRSLQRLNEYDLGFQHDHLLTFWLYPTLSGYNGEKELRLYERVLEGLNQLPGVRVASMSRLSLLKRGRSHDLRIDGASHPDASYTLAIVGPRLFDTLHLPILVGRDFSTQDNASSAPVAVINEAAAQKLFAGINPVGRRISTPDWEPGKERTIVGVVKGMKFSFRNDMPAEGIYIPYAQAPDEDRGQAMIKVDTAVDPANVIPSIARQVHEIAGELAPVVVEREDQVLDEENNSDERSLSRLLAGFGVLAVLLALIGLYGTVSYSVSRRIREIAIRMALGAQYSGLVWMIVSEALRVVLAGAVVGGGLAIVASRMLESFLFGVHGFDPPTYVALTATLLLAATIAAYLPARRAMSVDPIIALRHE